LHGSNLYSETVEATCGRIGRLNPWKNGGSRQVTDGKARSILVIGGGVFGLTAAVELARRGWFVRLFDAARPPCPSASSTDISKAVRMDYGADGFYAELAGLAMAGWRAWSARFGETLYHEIGFLLMRRTPMTPGTFESDSFETMRGRGVAVERVDGTALRKRFPAWNADLYRHGYFNPRAGWTPSGRVVDLLAEEALRGGVRIHEARAARLRFGGSRVTGVTTEEGSTFSAERVLVACGAWTPRLVPELDPVMRAVGQPVLHFAPDDPRPYLAPRFPVWGADIATTGWYGFPATPDGVVKIGNHGPGHAIGPGASLDLPVAEVERCREFLHAAFPDLARARLVGGRLCLYCDTPDGDFWIARHPSCEGLTVAAGGSGHGFKFAPVLGPIVADVVEGVPDPRADRFAWRIPRSGQGEQARFRGEAGS